MVTGSSLESKKIILQELKHAFKGILNNHKFINNEVKRGEDILSSGEWLLDNIYLIEKEYKAIKFNLPKSYYENLNQRIYTIAKDYVKSNLAIIDEKEIEKYINTLDYNLTMGELWAFPLMIRAALIINLAEITNTMVVLQKQRSGAKALAYEVIDAFNKGKLEEKLDQLENKYPIIKAKDIDSINEDKKDENKYMGDDESLHDGLFSPEFVDKFIKILKDNSIEDDRAIKFALDRLQSEGKVVDIEKLIIKEHIKEGAIESSIASIITALRNIDSISWKMFFEKVSVVEKVLLKDPSKIYEVMDFKTKDFYRHEIEKISRTAKIDELTVTKTALELCEREKDNKGYKSHIGYYLVDDGLKELLSVLGFKGKYNENLKPSMYVLTVSLITIAIDLLIVALSILISGVFSITSALLEFFIILIPASEIVLSVIRIRKSKTTTPSHILALDYSAGIPSHSKTIVIIPTLVTSKNRTKELLSQLELYYLSNRDENIYFALLGDFKDAKEKVLESDEEINKYGLAEVKALNNKYFKEGNEHFFFLNRERFFNPKEKVYMGRERKRGKIVEFINLIRGDKNHTYNVISSDISKLIDSKYIITLDADTILPMGTAKRLIGAMSHILNRPQIEDERVIKGYGLMQPKVGVTLEGKNKTEFTKLFAGDVGIDAYSTAYFDLYQDIFHEGIFTGKGILDIDVFYKVVNKEIPEDSILSHDLLEGELARTALISEVEVIDGYPSYYSSSCLRLHRWVRGDWQLLPWLFSKRLSTLSKWKIFDNLRRSLLAPSLLIGLLLSLTVLTGVPLIITLLYFVAILPLVFTVVDFVVTPKEKMMGTIKSFMQILVIVSFIPYQSYLMLDAIIRTLYRVRISRKNLLQWQTAEDAEKSVTNTLNSYYRNMWISPAVAIITLFLAFNVSLNIGFFNLPIIALWFFAPSMAYRISKIKTYKEEPLNEEDIRFLKSLSRRIWSYYEDFVNKENNYLAPDNYQQEPFKGLAHRTSPTNIGMALISNIVAYDLSYIDIKTMLERLENTIEGMESLEKHHGHYLNWYDTITKAPLWPRYISTVDSGNLLGYLWIIKEELNSISDKSLFKVEDILSLKDTYDVLKDEGYEVVSTIPENFDMKDYKVVLEGELNHLERILKSRKELDKEVNEKNSVEIDYWINKQIKDIQNKLNFYYFIFDGVEKLAQDQLNWYEDFSLNKLIEFLVGVSNVSGNEFKDILKTRIQNLREFKERISSLVSIIDKIMKDMDFKILFNEERGLFAIGYNLEENTLGNSFYDLMASEARATSFITIARGEVPKDHWYNLNRALTNTFGYKALASWSGTMFEYFMPYQIMKCYKDTIWDLTYSSVIDAQIYYGREKNTPWGISESAYYEFDLAKNYQYKAFGVPGIGLKRGLENELVISPYSSIMTLPYNSHKSISNLKDIKNIGAYGRYGFIEAIDYTKDDISDGSNKEYINCFMVHHLGMSLMALDNVINNKILQERFHSIPEIKAAELLLKERVPDRITFERPIDISKKTVNLEQEDFIPRVFDGEVTENPEVLLLSNGDYSTMITNLGSGYSKKGSNTVYRWKGDTTSDQSGMFFYIKNLNSNDYWSASYEPCKFIEDEYNVEFTLDKATFKRKDGNIESKCEVTLSAKDDVEIRTITLKNTGDKGRSIEVTSYMEVTLAAHEADAVHPGFSNLFISTDFDEENEALLGNRRARAKNGSSPWIFHKVISNYELEGAITYETSRLNFIGRNRDLTSPKAMDNDSPLINTVGTVLDPILSIRARVRLEPGEEKQLYFVTGVGDSKEEVISAIQKYSSVKYIKKSIEDFSHLASVELRYIGIKSMQANLYQQLANFILFLNTGRKDREEYIKNISLYQENLWPFGISGDLPIILLLINDEKDIDILRQVINMHYYFKVLGLKIDLIVYNSEEVSYDEPLQKEILNTIKASMEGSSINQAAGIYIHNKVTMGEDVLNLLKGIANIYMDSSKGNLINQMRNSNIEIASHYITHKELIKSKSMRLLPKKSEVKESKEKINKVNSNRYNVDVYREENIIGNDYYNKETLDFFNGYGGFDRQTNAYVITLKNHDNTPAPWINVISNWDFGFHISEVGSSYTWCGNSRENKLTPWSNDWVMDPLSEALYIRDDGSRTYFSITPKPVRDDGQYHIEHGFGYSTFKHTAFKIGGELTVFSPLGEKLKLCKVTLENKSSEDKGLTLFYYAQLVIGVYSYKSGKYINTEIEDNFIYGQNPFNKYFGKLKSYLTILGGAECSFTGDRREFIGGGGEVSSPIALTYDKLPNTSGAIYDPCLSASSTITLKAGEKKELVILLGAEEDKEIIKGNIGKYSNISQVNSELDKVKQYWSNFLGNIQVKTPDPSMDHLLNGWLMYQTLSCRYLSRTAFYQSGGAYGFRDQLQDSMSIGILDSSITREQILRSASRQYVEGDVQHWWHPVVMSGIRTRFSDDLLWLPYVTIEYIKSTGDYSILNERVSYLEDEPLREGEDERYTIVNTSSQEGTIFEHCIKATDRALKFGERNLPLMGSGDWNDGMSTVGNEGKGESVWLAWFLYTILDGFEPLCDHMKAKEKLKEYNKYKEFIRENLEKNAWDGGWYRRAYFDDGTPLGSRENDECQIDSLSQSWSVISKAAKKERAEEAMKAVDRHLVNEDKDIILLLAPPFNKTKLEPGYIKGYVPGVRENGGQYTHAATWVILAWTMLGDGDKAWKYYNMINPINHSSNEISAKNYKTEPYVMAADVYIKEPHGGRGGWSWYTGASGWMYKVGIENILGLRRIEGKGYTVKPCVPSNWNEYEINLKDEVGEYNIIVRRVKNEKEKGIIINGKKLNDDLIPKTRGKNKVEVLF